MNEFTHRLLAVLVVVALTTSCSSNNYWIPPSAAGASQAPLAPSAPAAQASPSILQTLVASTPADPPGLVPATLPPTAALPQSSTTVPGGSSAGNAALAPSGPVNTIPILYYVQAADTLPVVATRFGVQTSEISSTEPLPEQSFLDPGQLLIIPRRLANTTSSQKLLPDSDVVYSPSATDFDVVTFVNAAGGRLSTYKEWLKTSGVLTGAEMVYQVAIENSINPRLLLSLLEYKSHWVYGQPATQDQEDYPLGLIDPNQKGLYHQLVWAVNQLSIGYYAWREGRLSEIRFADGVTARLAPDLNAGSVALQYLFAQTYEGQPWLDTLKAFPALHERLFGSPWQRAEAVEPLFPPGITQPPLTLPFARNWVWAFTGGPHGAWEHEGSYAALDFAPGSTESECAHSDAWVTAVASGLVTRSGNGVVAIDLDGDGHEQTGWVILYLHVSSEHRIPVGSQVDLNDQIGHPSCEGGVATGTHVHIARKYNGEWIPADGPLPFNLGGWIAHAGPVAYKGTLTRDGQTLTACTCSNAATFVTRTDSDP